MQEFTDEGNGFLMTATLKTLFDILLLRAGPEDLPSSTRLLWGTFALLVALLREAGIPARPVIGVDSGGDDGAVLLWHKDATRLRRIDLAAALGTLLDPLGRPLTAAGAALPAVRELVYLGLISRVSRAISPL
jgi:hypothetical protein